MPYKGFVGAGTVGHFFTTTDLQARFPADLYAGRRATVEIVTGTATQYFSDGVSWKAVPTLVTDPFTGGSVALNAPGGEVLPILYGASPAGVVMQTPNLIPSAITLNSNWRTLMSVPEHYDSVQIGLVNVDATQGAIGLKVAVAASDSVLNNGSNPTTLGVRDDARWVNVTFGGNTSANLPINPYVVDGQYVAPAITWSDDIPLASMPRIDSPAADPLFMVSIYLPASGLGNVGYANGLTTFTAEYEAVTGRLFRAFTQAGSDRTSAPAGWTGTGTDSIQIAAVVAMVRFSWRGKVISVANFGDSTFQGVGAAGGLNWVHRALSRSPNKIAVFNGGASGDRSTNYRKRFADIFNQLLPDVVIWQVSTINDGALTDAIVSAQKGRAMEVVALCRKYGVRVVLVSPMPSSNSVLPAAVQARYVNLLSFVNSFTGTFGVFPLDISSIHATPGQWIAGYNDGDQFHPNQTATTALTQLLRAATPNIFKLV